MKNVIPDIKFIVSFISSLLKVAKNSKYPLGYFAHSLINTATEKQSLEAYTQWQRKHIRIPSADDIFYHLEKMSFDPLCEEFNQINQLFAKLLKPLLPREVVFAIDITEFPYYGDKNHHYITAGKHKAGTIYFFKEASLLVAEFDKAFTLAVRMVDVFTTKEDLIREFVKIAKEYAKPRLFLIDRGFWGSPFFKILNELEVHWLMPVHMNKKIKRLGKQVEIFTPFEYTMKGVKFWIFFIDEKHAFATNKCPENPEMLALEYRARWEIETGYREERKFLIRTCTRNFVIRHFFFLLANLLYNLWILCRNGVVRFACWLKTKRGVLRGDAFRRALREQNMHVLKAMS